MRTCFQGVISSRDNSSCLGREGKEKRKERCKGNPSLGCRTDGPMTDDPGARDRMIVT